MEDKKSSEVVVQKEKRIGWWREAKFGMFIHWGLYAIPAGIWNGEEIPGIGEWIMHRARIPVAEYEKLAKQFNPVKFNAEEWVKVAKDAGMKYIVITAKHHDGFAMYDSKVSTYDIVDATPFGRDPMKELEEACQKEGIKLCFYYSHVQDWHHPDVVGNDWDFPDETKKDFARYLEEKAKPQIRELLTQYGPVGIIWFDTPKNITKEHSKELADLVHELQPDCLVSGRVGHDLGDYLQLGDNQIPVRVIRDDWETPATLNDTWGYKKNDHNWKVTKDLIRLLVDIVSKGGNYLLNVGPTAEGVIPQPSVEKLREVGKWLKANGEAIYGTSASPFPYELEWGAITVKPGKLYFHVFDWPQQGLVLYGLKNKVKKAYLLADKLQRELNFVQEYDSELDYHKLKIDLPACAPDENVSVVVVEIEGEPEVDSSILQRPGGEIVLEGFLADIHRASTDSQIEIARSGIIQKWFNKEDWLSWNFKVIEPATFEVRMMTVTGRWNMVWDSGHEFKISVANQDIDFTVEDHGRVMPRSSFYAKNVVTKCGQVRIPAPGVYTLTLKPKLLKTDKGSGPMLRSINLVPLFQT